MAIAPILPVTSHLVPAQEIDVELFTFIERYATNLARWDLFILFGRRPTSRFSASEIAKQIGRTTRSVQKELDDLVYLGILRVNHNSGNALYGLTRTPVTRRAVVRLAREYGNS
jgi:DNA-binding MarR family transcriptional regulator